MNILYIGNDLAKKTNYNSTMSTLSELLISSGFNVVKTSSRSNKILRLLEMLFSVFIYRKKVKYILIDTFSTTNFYYAYLTSQFARLLSIRYIPILHGGNLPARLEKSKKMSSAIFTHSYVNVAPSNYLKTKFEKKGFTSVLIPNILEIVKYKFKNRNSFQPKLLWVRAFDEIYNPTLAIKVLKLLKHKYPDSVLTMVGPDKDDSIEEVIKLIDVLNLKDSVKITGVLKKEEWHKLAEDSDIFINTTNIDNTPVSVMESMALGLPVVSTNVGGLPYLIENNIDGLLVNKNDAELMCNAVIHLLTHKNVALKIANKARIKAESYSWGVVKKEWLELLN
jgi:colanic acid/amylovoran biosynthesis glycosyltransferase